MGPFQNISIIVALAEGNCKLTVSNEEYNDGSAFWRLTTMEKPVFQPIGTPILELDTPALVVDMEIVETNLRILVSQFFGTSINIRPHVSSHGCPNIARKLIDNGQNVSGIAVSTVGEAEVFAEAGFRDILIANQVVTESKIRKVCSLADSNCVAVHVDNLENIARLSDTAVEREVVIGCLVEVDVGLGRSGVDPTAALTDMAHFVDSQPGLTFVGIVANLIPFSDDRPSQQPDIERQIGIIAEARRSIVSTGLSVETLSVRSDGNFDFITGSSDVTEVQVDPYPLMDYRSVSVNSEFKPAVRILASVLSQPVPSRVVIDAGHKTTGPDLGLPVLDGISGVWAARFSAEHGSLEVSDNSHDELVPNGKVWLIPYDLALCVNQFDYFRVVRKGVLDGFWPISSRGRFG
jgi:3-hydroxy-D-aspartate aldolase